MHTRAKPGIDITLANDLSANFTWSPPIAVTCPPGSEVDTSGPESISVDELDSAPAVDPQLVDGSEVLEGQVYDLDEMQRVDKGIAPLGFQDDVQDLMMSGELEAGTWSIQALLSSKGVTTT